MEKTLLSFTIPCYRSEETVASVIEEIDQMVSKNEHYEYEIIAVNDCSPDHVYDVLCRMAAADQRIKVIDLAINGGKHAALMAAFSCCRGDYVIGVDDDGQCPLDRLWDLIEPLTQGYDMAMARYAVKKQSGFKNFGSRVNSWMSSMMLEKPRNLIFSNFTARKRFLIDEILKYQNPYPYLEGITLKITRNIALVDMEERSRSKGTSGYSFKKSLALFANGLTAFSVKPLRIASILGLLCSGTGFILALVLILRMLLGSGQTGYAALISVVLLVGGILMLLIGIMGEYIGRMYICMNHVPQYVIRETVNILEKR